MIPQERDEEMNYKAHQMAKGLADERKRIAIETAYFNKSLSEQQKMEAHRNKFRCYVPAFAVRPGAPTGTRGHVCGPQSGRLRGPALRMHGCRPHAAQRSHSAAVNYQNSIQNDSVLQHVLTHRQSIARMDPWDLGHLHRRA